MLDRWIFLYGPPGSGKSELGRRLAAALDLPFYDLDALIEARTGRTIPELFSQEGEAGFRRRESEALQSLLTSPRSSQPAGRGPAPSPATSAATGGGQEAGNAANLSSPAILALGGGALLDPENRRLAESSGTVLSLSAPFETLLSRVQAGEGAAARAAGRPLLSGDTRQRLESLLTQRAAHYASFPLQFVSDDRPADDNAWQLQLLLGAFRIRGMGKPYDVRITPAGLGGLGAALRQRGLQGPVALVTDSNLAQFHLPQARASLEAAGYTVVPVVIPAGEAHKTAATLLELWAAFLQGGLERGSTVVALGGGVVGDLAGFAAAAYLRGVTWVAVPTSLLAMVDASLGGKTGADLPQGKNLIGAFHPPALVLADPQTLETLPEAELRNGLAEVVKHGVIADPGLFELCAAGRAALDNRWDELVRRAVAVKVKVIEADPYERGQRAALNLGHSLGHAIEAASDFRIKHGEAVAMGMVQAAKLAEQQGEAAPGLADQISACLEAQGLPVRVPPDLDRQRLLAGMGVDKKRAAGKLHVVLPVRIGEVRWGIPLDDPALLIDV